MSNSRIPLCEPHLGGREGEYLAECIATNWVSSGGPFVTRFEREAADFLGVAGAVSTSSGTAALHVALRVLGIGAGDVVPVSTLTFIAPANAAHYLGAVPRFIDAEATTAQMDVGALQRYLDRDCARDDAGVLRERETGLRVAALLPVHILGHVVSMAPVLDLARRYDLPVVEDATESLGARYRGEPVGALGTVGCLSFNGNKLLTAGSGGMIVSNDVALIERARHLVNQAKHDPIEFVHDTVGYNYRMSNIQAAVGTAQMERIADHLEAKRKIAERYDRAFAEVPGITTVLPGPDVESAWWLYTVRVDPDAFGIDRRALMRLLGERRIEARPLWQPLHMSPAYEASRRARGEREACPVAERLQQECLSLPSSVGLTEVEQERVIAAVHAAAREQRLSV